MGTIAAMRAAAVLINKSDIGYDQSQRWSFYDAKKNTIVKHKESDCSSTIGAIIKIGGYPIDLTGTFWTGNLVQKAKAAGWTAYHFESLSQLKTGDVLVKVGHHTEFVYSPSEFFSAHIDERGKASGGKAGNQTGREVCFRSAYNWPGGWDYVLRPPAEQSTAVQSPAAGKLAVNGALDKNSIAALQRVLGTPVDGLISKPVSPMVKALQTFLNGHGASPKLIVDGELGEKTIRALQKYLGTPVDGVISKPVSPMVKALQTRLNTGRL